MLLDGAFDSPICSNHPLLVYSLHLSRLLLQLRDVRLFVLIAIQQCIMFTHMYGVELYSVCNVHCVYAYIRSLHTNILHTMMRW